MIKKDFINYKTELYDTSSEQWAQRDKIKFSTNNMSCYM